MLNIPILRSSIFKSGVLNSKKILNNRVPQNPQSIKYVPQSIKDSFEIVGKGAEGIVYKIKNSNFALKINNNKKIEEELNNPINLAINKLDKTNHVKAKIGNHISIMKYIEGSPISVNISSKTLPTSSIKECLKYIYNTASEGFRHDFGGKNILFNKKNGKLTPIDFLPSRAGYKENIINNTFIQLYPTAKTSEDVNKLLSKISLAFVELLKDNTISKKGLKNISGDLKQTKDIININKEFADSTTFVNSLERKLQDIINKKANQGISKDFHDNYINSLEALEKELKATI